MKANYLLRLLIGAGVVNVAVVAQNEDDALKQAIQFVGYESEQPFELYDVRSEVARRVC